MAKSKRYSHNLFGESKINSYFNILEEKEKEGKAQGCGQC